jgi:hypothetical protein
VRLFYGCTKIQDVKGENPPKADNQYETDCSCNDKMQQLRKSGIVTQGMLKMRVLPGQAGYPSGIEGIKQIIRGKKWTICLIK